MYKVGDIIDGYRLLHECGTGAYGTVFRAENDATGEIVALKVVYAMGTHYDREIKGLIKYRERCSHRNLMAIHHVAQFENGIYYTMNLADNLSTGGDYIPDTLANRIRKHGVLSSDAIIQMGLEILEGLEVLHSHGLVHRDIKPDNILWINGQAVLADIGLMADNGQTTLAGTPGFISPALLNGNGKADMTDDLYALGKVLYCALTGNAVRDFPHFPETRTLTGAGRVIRAYTAACEKYSPIRTVADFRSRLQNDRVGKSRSWKTLGGYFALLCLLLLILGKVINYMQTKSIAEPQPHLSKELYKSYGQAADDTAF